MKRLSFPINIDRLVPDRIFIQLAALPVVCALFCAALSSAFLLFFLFFRPAANTLAVEWSGFSAGETAEMTPDRIFRRRGGLPGVGRALFFLRPLVSFLPVMASPTSSPRPASSLIPAGSFPPRQVVAFLKKMHLPQAGSDGFLAITSLWRQGESAHPLPPSLRPPVHRAGPPAWFLRREGVAGWLASALAAGYLLIRLNRMKAIRKKRPELEPEAKMVLDAGVQEMFLLEAVAAPYAFRLRLRKDPGEQAIECAAGLTGRAHGEERNG